MDPKPPRMIVPYSGTMAYEARALWCMAGRRKDIRDRPPVSRMGSKGGLAGPVLQAWGYDLDAWSEIRANDLCPAMHVVHHVYASPRVRDQAARTVSSLIPCPVCLPGGVRDALDGFWHPTPTSCLERLLVERGRRTECVECGGTGLQDARRLWERVRRQPVPVPTSLDELGWLAGLVAFMQSRSFQLKPVTFKGGTWETLGIKAEWYGDKNGQPNGHGYDSPRWTVADRIQTLPGEWAPVGFNGELQSAARQGGYAAFNNPRWRVADRLGHLPGRWDEGGFGPEGASWNGRNKSSASRWSVADPIGNGPDQTGCNLILTCHDAALMVPDRDSPGDLVILDPPYLGKLTQSVKAKRITGYAHESTRETALMLAREWHRADANVLIHEACGLDEELGHPWKSGSVNHLRANRSSFWPGGHGGEREYLTWNRDPV